MSTSGIRKQAHSFEENILANVDQPFANPMGIINQVTNIQTSHTLYLPLSLAPNNRGHQRLNGYIFNDAEKKWIILKQRIHNY